MQHPSFPTISGVASAALVALALGACSGPASVEDAAPIQQTTLLTIRDSGAGALGPSVPATKAAIEAALPGDKVAPIMMASETRNETALAAFKDGLQVVQVIPGPGNRIAEVHGVTAGVAGPNGERVGMTFTEAHQDPAACRPGKGNWLGMPICRARGTQDVTLVFAVPGYITGGVLPSAAELQTATLQRIIWTPGATT